MSKMVTRCPQCQTSFRVTDEHLKIANGAVRCGSCLNVFQAKDHWVPDVPPRTTSATPTAPVTPAAPEKSSSRFTSPIPTPSFLQAADKLAATSQAKNSPTPASTANPAPTASQFQFKQAVTEATPKGKFQFDQSSIDSGSASSFLAEPDERIPETALTKAHTQPVTDSDNKPAVDTNNTDAPTSTELPAFGTDDDDYSSLFDESDMANAESEDFESLLADNFDDLDSLIENKPVKEEEADVSDDTWAKDLLDELEDEIETAPANTSDTDQDNGFPLDFSNPTDVDAARRDLGLDDPSRFDMNKFVPISIQTVALSSDQMPQGETNEKPDVPVVPVKQARQQSTSREDLIAHIGPAPVEINPIENSTPAAWKTALAEIGICIVLVLCLAGQHLFFQFDHLAKQESTRPMVAFVCSVLRCTLPPSEVWRNIRVSNLVVRKHDTVANALLVDAIIFNHASYELPFPKLELYFNDLEQLPVASRRFEPHEYLAGELEGKTLMPPGRPIHIAFEIVNPGDKAVNWQLDVTPFQ